MCFFGLRDQQDLGAVTTEEQVKFLSLLCGVVWSHVYRVARVPRYAPILYEVLPLEICWPVFTTESVGAPKLATLKNEFSASTTAAPAVPGVPILLRRLVVVFWATKLPSKFSHLHSFLYDPAKLSRIIYKTCVRCRENAF